MYLYQPFEKLEKRGRFGKKSSRLGLWWIFIFAAIILLAAMFSSIFGRLDPSLPVSDQASPEITPKSLSTTSAVPLEPKLAEAEAGFSDAKEQNRRVKGILEKGDTLYHILLDKKVKKSTIHTVIQQLSPMMPPRALMPGDRFVLTLDEEENLHRFEYSKGPVQTYIVERGEDGEWNSFQKRVELEKYWAVISGQVEDSLVKSIIARGGDTMLANKFADIFAWKIDFHNEPRKGDKFRLVVEKYLLKDNFIQYGDILAAEYNGYCGLHQAILFQCADGKSDYYDLKGVSLRRAFLRAPLEFNYISSGYSQHRLHPILGCVRPHLGIDYAAPLGTPVRSVADGIVISARYEGGNGNQVIVQHMNGYQTCYNHLSRFGKDIKKGVRIQQKRIIGYVGTTGLSTGPHLDYRVKHYGRYINPLKTDFPTGQKLEIASKKSFHQLAYNLLHFMYDSQQEKWICKVLAHDQKVIVE